MTQYTYLAELKWIDRPRNHIPLNLTPWDFILLSKTAVEVSN